MKTKMLALGILTLVTSSFLATSVNAAEVVGTQSYEISWTKEPGALGYEIYFGQTDTHRKDTAVAGLAHNSERLTLNYLKPCTQYSYNVQASLSGNSRKWLWRDDVRFVTGGDCGPKKMTNAPGVTLVSDVVTTTEKTGKNSSTINWSKKPGASGYTVYYRNETSNKYDSAVKVPAEGSTLTIKELTPGMNYYYQVCARVENKDQCYGEKMLQQKTGVKPVLGTSTTNTYGTPKAALAPKKILGASDRMGLRVSNETRTCDMNKKVTLNWGTTGSSISKFHVVYGKRDGQWDHSVRDLPDQARNLTVGYLDSCATYWFEVWAVNTSGSITRMNPRVTTL